MAFRAEIESEPPNRVVTRPSPPKLGSRPPAAAAAGRAASAWSGPASSTRTPIRRLELKACRILDARGAVLESVGAVRPVCMEILSPVGRWFPSPRDDLAPGSSKLSRTFGCRKFERTTSPREANDRGAAGTGGDPAFRVWMQRPKTDRTTPSRGESDQDRRVRRGTAVRPPGRRARLRLATAERRQPARAHHAGDLLRAAEGRPRLPEVRGRRVPGVPASLHPETPAASGAPGPRMAATPRRGVLERPRLRDVGTSS